MAHRLQTILDYDKIVSGFPYIQAATQVTHFLQMVLDAGRIVRSFVGCLPFFAELNDGFFKVEFGPPMELLQNNDGHLKSLVDASGDKDKLYELATKGGKSWRS